MRELVLRAHIQNRRRSGAQPGEQLVARDRLELVPGPKIACHDPRDLGAVALANPAEREQQADDGLLSSKAVEYALAVTPALDESGTTKKLQVPRRICQREAGPRRQILDAALGLAEMFEQFETMRVTERLSDPRQTGEYVLFWTHA